MAPVVDGPSRGVDGAGGALDDPFHPLGGRVFRLLPFLRNMRAGGILEETSLSRPWSSDSFFIVQSFDDMT